MCRFFSPPIFSRQYYIENRKLIVLSSKESFATVIIVLFRKIFFWLSFQEWSLTWRLMANNIRTFNRISLSLHCFCYRSVLLLIVSLLSCYIYISDKLKLYRLRCDVETLKRRLCTVRRNAWIRSMCKKNISGDLMLNISIILLKNYC